MTGVRPAVCPAAPVLIKRGNYASGSGDADVGEEGGSGIVLFMFVAQMHMSYFFVLYYYNNQFGLFVCTQLLYFSYRL